jgi:hypothetical protein
MTCQIILYIVLKINNSTFIMVINYLEIVIDSNGFKISHIEGYIPLLGKGMSKIYKLRSNYNTPLQ